METKVMIAARVSQDVFDKIDEARKISDLSTRQLIERALNYYYKSVPELNHLAK